MAGRAILRATLSDGTGAATEAELLRLGREFTQADLELVRALTKRAKLSIDACKVKRGGGLSIVRRDIEEKRIKEVGELAKEMGHPDPKWVMALFRNAIIPHSVASQTAYLEKHPIKIK